MPTRTISFYRLIYGFLPNPTPEFDLLSSSFPLSSLHTCFSPWLFMFFAKSISHSVLGNISSLYKALLISHNFLCSSFYFQQKSFPQCDSWQFIIFHTLIRIYVLQPIHILCLRLFFSINMKNLVLFPHRH